jgi:hypothetical protein
MYVEDYGKIVTMYYLAASYEVSQSGKNYFAASCGVFTRQ